MALSWKELLHKSEAQLTEKQRRIIIAAIELFGEQGYANTSTRQIAQRAQVSEGSIFKLFPTKKALLLYITQQSIRHIAPQIFNYGLPQLFSRQHESLEDFLRLLLHNRLELIESNIILAKVVLQEAMFQPEIRQVLLQSFQQNHIIDGIKQMKQRGLLADKPEAELINIFATAFIGYIFSRYIMLPELFTEHKEQDREQFVQFMARALSA